MKYLKSAFIGIIVSCFVLAIFAAIYWDAKLIIVWLLQGAAQGLLSVLIYNKRLRIVYLLKFIIHTITSYLLVLISLLLTSGFWGGVSFSNIIEISISWFIVFVIIFIYFYYTNYIKAQRINERLNKK